MTSQPGNQTIAIHILPNISSSEGDHTLRFGPFIEYNMRSIFLEKSYPNLWGRNYSQTFFQKTKIEYISV